MRINTDRGFRFQRYDLSCLRFTVSRNNNICFRFVGDGKCTTTGSRATVQLLRNGLLKTLL